MADRLAALLQDGGEHGDAGRLEEALLSFTAACDLDPTCAKAHEQRSQLLLEMDQSAAAVAAAERAVSLAPAWAHAWLTLGRSSLNLGKFGAASMALRKAVQLDPSLHADADDDIRRSQQLQLESDLAELVMHTNAKLQIQQWRDIRAIDHGTCGGCHVGSCDTIADADTSTRQGTGTMVWECGIVLAKLLDHWAAGNMPQTNQLSAALSFPARSRPAIADGAALTGLRVLELGSGTGIGGLAAAALGASVILTDLPEVLPLLAANCTANRTVINSAGGTAIARAADWADVWGTMASHSAAPPEPSQEARDFDLVIAADVLYQPSHAQLDALATALAQLTRDAGGSNGGVRLLLVHKSRHEAIDRVIAPTLLERAALELIEVPFELHHPQHRSPSIHVYVGIPVRSV